MKRAKIIQSSHSRKEKKKPATFAQCEYLEKKKTRATKNIRKNSIHTRKMPTNVCIPKCFFLNT